MLGLLRQDWQARLNAIPKKSPRVLRPAAVSRGFAGLLVEARSDLLPHDDVVVNAIARFLEMPAIIPSSRTIRLQFGFRQRELFERLSRLPSVTCVPYDVPASYLIERLLRLLYLHRDHRISGRTRRTLFCSSPRPITPTRSITCMFAILAKSTASSIGSSTMAPAGQTSQAARQADRQKTGGRGRDRGITFTWKKFRSGRCRMPGRRRRSLSPNRFNRYLPLVHEEVGMAGRTAGLGESVPRRVQCGLVCESGQPSIRWAGRSAFFRQMVCVQSRQGTNR